MKVIGPGGREEGYPSQPPSRAISHAARTVLPKAVVAESFERIHRSNLVGMGVLPCQFKEGTNAASLNLDGSETFDITGLVPSDHNSDGSGNKFEVTPRMDVTLTIHRADGRKEEVPVVLRIDTAIEIDYYLHGGILPYVLRQLLAGTTGF